MRAIAAARRRLPMVEIDAQTPLIGAEGSVRLIDIFEGRSQLISYFHMWHPGQASRRAVRGLHVQHVIATIAAPARVGPRAWRSEC